LLFLLILLGRFLLKLRRILLLLNLLFALGLQLFQLFSLPHLQFRLCVIRLIWADICREGVFTFEGVLVLGLLHEGRAVVRGMLGLCVLLSCGVSCGRCLAFVRLHAVLHDRRLHEWAYDCPEGWGLLESRKGSSALVAGG
jgi:hypothetical protein